ncbi:MAG: hypothetical protein ACFFDD_06475 [Promethearchaeota archaeon]
MKEALSSHDFRGLSLIADFYMIAGAAVIGVSLLLLFTGALTALIAIGYGVIIVTVGYYLDDLHPVAWWFAVITNFAPLVFFLYDFFVTDNPTTGFAIILNLALSILIVGYLVRPKVRSLFFENTSSPD